MRHRSSQIEDQASPGVDLVHHAQGLVELARIDMSDEPMSRPPPSAVVLAEACTEECIEVAAVLTEHLVLPPSLVRGAVRRVADDGWEAESVLHADRDAVSCEELDLFFRSLDAEDFEDLDSDTLELREHLRCD